MHEFDVFSVASSLFWRTQPGLIAAFFAHLSEIGSRGFLAANDVSVCEAASAQHRIQCIVSNNYRHDGALSKERWMITLSVLRRGHRIAYAGLDVRFLQPVASWFNATSDLDLAFEGNYGLQKIGHFTPDFALAQPTPSAIHFMEGLVSVIRSRSLAGLPAFLQDPVLLRFNLMGPAEQDLLKDFVNSALYNTS